MTRIVSAKEGIAEGAELIRRGELVVFPTETVYGLGANAFDEKAVSKIFEAKGRPQDNPLIVHISSLSEVRDIANEIPEEFYALAEKFMPGPLTVILKKSDKIPYIVTAGGDTVGIRMPDNVYARELIAQSFPLAAPSANKSKHISPTSALHVYDDLKGEVELILDGGACGVGIESTVLDLTSDTPAILRPGAVTAQMLAEILGEVGQNGNVIKIAKAPGMKYAHYAPKVGAAVAYETEKAIAEYDRKSAEGLNPVIVALEDFSAAAGNRNTISLGDKPKDYAKNIYAALRIAEQKYGYIVIQGLDGDGLEASVMNRVKKAAGGKIL